MQKVIPAQLKLSALQNEAAQTALKRLEAVGLPTKKSEAYRYFDIESLLNKEYDFIVPEKQPVVEGERLEIVDGNVLSVPKGIEVHYSKERPILKDHFDPLYYLGHLLSKEVITITCKNDADFEIHHRFTKPDAFTPYRIVCNVEKNVQVRMSESFSGCDAKGSFILYGIDLSLERDAQVELIKDETLTQNIYTPIASHAFTLADQSALNLYSFDFGYGSGLELLQIVLGAHTTLEAKHLLFAQESAKRGIVSQIVHAKESARSNQSAKNILQDKARGIFDALIKIEKSGGGAKAYQNSKAVLLNDGAYMASKPQLEIYIDDVEASHGSTIGELDEDQLFYLRSRGISLTEARKILILAFANEIIDSIDDEKVRESVHRSFEEIYYGHAQLECISTCHTCSDTILGDEA